MLVLIQKPGNIQEDTNSYYLLCLLDKNGKTLGIHNGGRIKSGSGKKENISDRQFGFKKK